MRNVKIEYVEVQDWMGRVLDTFDTIDEALTFEEKETDKYNVENGYTEDDPDFDNLLDDLYIIPHDSEGRELPLEI